MQPYQKKERSRKLTELKVNRLSKDSKNIICMSILKLVRRFYVSNATICRYIARKGLNTENARKGLKIQKTQEIP